MRAALTGATGFLGHALVEALVASGAEPSQLTSLARSRSERLEALGCRQVTGDLQDEGPLVEAFRGAEVVFHLAGRVSRDPRDAAALYDLHVRGTQRVLDVALGAGVSRVVLCSTSGTVGCSVSPKVVADDSSPWCSSVVAGWPYYRTKLEAERLALSHGARTGLAVVSLNPSLLLGPGDARGSSTGDVRAFLARRVPSVPAGGLSLVDVRDAAAAFAAAATRGEPGTRYLLGARNLTVAELFADLERLTGVPAPKLRLPAWLERLGGTLVERAARVIGRPPPLDRISVEMAQHFWYIDSSRAARDLGFTPRPTDDTLRDTVAWLRAHA
ncbi:MAG: NAD-dependent epimerase/dehydratase family protein [Deltaproteobacteria bacterium]|nr:NAD-dependent epimerase/dehydratase family protein [Deltaproteobacteria bacterium]